MAPLIGLSSSVTTVRIEDTCSMSAPVPETSIWPSLLTLGGVSNPKSFSIHPTMTRIYPFLTRPNKIAPGWIYKSPDVALCLIGGANEAEILIDDIPVTALVDTVAQVSTIFQDFCLSQGYDILTMTQMLWLEDRELSMPYSGHVEASIKYPKLRGMMNPYWFWRPHPTVIECLSR